MGVVIVGLRSKETWRLMLVFVLGFVLAGCIGTNRRELAHKVARGGMLYSEVIRTDFFNMFSYSRFARAQQSLTIYIEGDGMAWINRHTLSKDPTPRNPLALKLAALDPAPNVAYLGRPCQYVKKQQRKNCQVEYWSTRRFAEEVVSSTNQAIDQLKKQAQANSIQLVGYSGGGAVAVLVAARRTDVTSIRTIAGNLDHVTFTKHHRVTPLSGSLNPMDVAEKVKKIPQIHFVGGRDKIVPPFIVGGFVLAQGKGACARSHNLAGMKHGGEWEEIWPNLLQRNLPGCQ
jgi:hypothetical protein